MNLIVSENLQEIVFSGRKFTILNRVRAAILLHGSRHGWERLKWLLILMIIQLTTEHSDFKKTSYRI
jgi:hypothetical protein